MPYYSDELIEEVRSRNDIVDVIGSYVHLQKKGSTYFGLCPFHNEKTGSFSVSPNKQMYYCFGCGAGGNVFTFLMQYENFTFPEAMQELADRVGIELPKQEMTSAQRREADRRTQLLEINKEAAKYFYMLLRGPRGQRAHEYFKKRELSDETMQKFGLGYSDQYSDDLYKYLRSKGYVVKVFNLIQPENSDSWNCLAEIEGDELMAQIFCDIIIRNTGSEKGDHFWNAAEMNLLKALVLYVALGYPSESRNIGEVYKLLVLNAEKELDNRFSMLPASHPARAPYGDSHQCIGESRC